MVGFLEKILGRKTQEAFEKKYRLRSIEHIMSWKNICPWGLGQAATWLKTLTSRLLSRELAERGPTFKEREFGTTRVMLTFVSSWVLGTAFSPPLSENSGPPSESTQSLAVGSDR